VGSARSVWLPGPLRVDVHLGAHDTGGAFCLVVDHPRPGWALPPHRHAGESETIHVVAGRFEVVVGDERVVAGPGESVHVPRGVRHSGAAIGDEPGKRLLIFAPAGMERFFLDAGTASADEVRDPGHLLALAERHGWRFG
jgi:hypothetical protein